MPVVQFSARVIYLYVCTMSFLDSVDQCTASPLEVALGKYKVAYDVWFRFEVASA